MAVGVTLAQQPVVNKDDGLLETSKNSRMSTTVKHDVAD